MPAHGYTVRVSRSQEEEIITSAAERITPPIVAFGENPVPESHAGQVVAIALGHASHDTFTSMLAPLLPLFIANLSLSKTEAGLLTSFMQGPSVLQPFIGHLSDQRDLRYVFALAPTCTALAMGLLGLVPSYAILVILLLLAGVSSAAWHGIGPGLYGRLSDPRKLGRDMALWMAGGELGYALGPLLVVSIVDWAGLSKTPWMSAVGVLGSVLIFRCLRGIPKIEGKSDAKQPPIWQALLSMRRMVLPITGLVVTRSFALCALGSFLPTFLREGGTSFWLSGVALTIYQIAATLGGFLGGSLSDRLGRRAIILASMLAAPLLLLVFLALTGAAQLGVLAVIGAIMFSFEPVVLALVQENYAGNGALAAASYLSMLFIVRCFVVVIVGAVADRLGLRWAFAASAFVLLLGAPIVFLLPGGRDRLRA